MNAVGAAEGARQVMSACADELADVIVRQSCPINFGTHEIWEGDLITRQLNLGQPWTPDDFVDFCEALTTAYDAYRAAEAKLSPAHSGPAMNPTNIRAIATVYIRNGESMIDVPALLDITWDELMAALSNNNGKAFYTSWGDIEWLKFESSIAGDGPFGLRPLLRELGLPMNAKNGLIGLLQLYDKPIKKAHPDDIGVIVRQAVEDGVTAPQEIHVLIEAAGLTPPSLEAIRLRVRAARLRSV